MGGEGSQCPADRQIGRAFKSPAVEPTLAAAVLDKTGLCIPTSQHWFRKRPVAHRSGAFYVRRKFQDARLRFPQSIALAAEGEPSGMLQ